MSDEIERVREKIKRVMERRIARCRREIKRNHQIFWRRRGTDRTWEGGVSVCLCALVGIRNDLHSPAGRSFDDPRLRIPFR